MKKILLTTALIACCLTTLFAQPCLPAGITFTTQEEIDNFQINYPNCNEIEGDVWIQGGDIWNLAGLSVLTSTGGELSIIENYSLASLEGLDNLTSIGSDLQILNNVSLASLVGMENLNSISGNLQIGHYTFPIPVGHPSLTSLTGLNNLTSIG